jgi:hypothetical protein
MQLIKIVGIIKVDDKEKKILKAINDLIRLEKQMLSRDNYVNLGNLGYLVESHIVIRWAEEIKMIKDDLKIAIGSDMEILKGDIGKNMAEEVGDI